MTNKSITDGLFYWAISKDENDELVYHWDVIDRAAAKHTICADILRDFVFANIEGEMSAEDLINAYFEYRDAEKEALNDSIYCEQERWYLAHPDCVEPTSDRTDEMINQYLRGYESPSAESAAAIQRAMDAWISEVREEYAAKTTEGK